jgi:succinoglycan biosynthesis protein ExoM
LIGAQLKINVVTVVTNRMILARKNICVCICTYKRPDLLKRLLYKLQGQKTEDLYNYSIVVVDNDSEESGRHITELWSQQSKISIRYFVEPEQNIALARNKAVENAIGDFIAFIDDDEFPKEDWLLNLYKAINAYRAEGVLGPVIPYFDKEPPRWIIRGKLCERKSFPTGTILKNPKDTRTGNVLLSKNIFDEKSSHFDPAFGRTGGEDVNFFKKQIQKGKTFIWCNEASVYEIVPPVRFKRSFFVKRALLRGIVNSEEVHFLSYNVSKSVIAIIIYTLSLPVLLLTRHDQFMKYLIKDCDHLGKLLALFGLRIIKER